MMFDLQIILDMLPYNGLNVYHLAETNQKALSLLEETYKYKPKTSPSVIMIESQTSFSQIQIPEHIEGLLLLCLLCHIH